MTWTEKGPVARAHITLEDDGPYATLEILNGELLQPSMSPVDLYVRPPTETEDEQAGWTMSPYGQPIYIDPCLSSADSIPAPAQSPDTIQKCAEIADRYSYAAGQAILREFAYALPSTEDK